jgi:hypothetical protein
MTQKHLRDVAIVILVVFIITVVVYPLIFGTAPHPKNEPPVELELKKEQK